MVHKLSSLFGDTCQFRVDQSETFCTEIDPYQLVSNTSIITLNIMLKTTRTTERFVPTMRDLT